MHHSLRQMVNSTSPLPPSHPNVFYKRLDMSSHSWVGKARQAEARGVIEWKQPSVISGAIIAVNFSAQTIPLHCKFWCTDHPSNTPLHCSKFKCTDHPSTLQWVLVLVHRSSLHIAVNFSAQTILLHCSKFWCTDRSIPPHFDLLSCPDPIIPCFIDVINTDI